jgi:AcrR family transcriptional regulator
MATSTRQRKTTGARLSADERREQVLDAAVGEFGERGYHAASTASIAKRAGISQPYIYALFADKGELFRAVHKRVIGAIQSAFVQASAGASTPVEALTAMGQAYKPLMEDGRLLSAQLQCMAAAAGDPELREYVRTGFRSLVDDVARLSGADPAAVAGFFACGMYINVALALDAPDLVAPLLTESDDEPSAA